jgi:N-acetylmuramoyl-L-alanine amidase
LKIKIKQFLAGILIIFVIVSIIFAGNINNMLTLVNAQEKGASDEQLLARVVNGEARGEPYEGQVAVAAVIINRTRDPKFPKTLAGVIYQPSAFTAVSDGQINVPIDPDSTVVKAVRDALNGWDPTNGCIYYWNPATATSKWIWSRTIVKKIGKHYFGK